MSLNQLSGRINVEVMSEQWWDSLIAAGWRFQEVLDGTGRDPPNPTYTCVVKMTPRGQYITWKNTLRKRIGTSKQRGLRRKTLWNKKLNLFQGEIDRDISVNPFINVKFNRFSFGINLILWHPCSTNLLFGLLTFEPNTNLGSLQIKSLQ